MLRLAADENFNGRILRAITQHVPQLDIVRIQDTEIAAADDPTVLAWAAAQDRILLTHDVKTLVGFAFDRVRDGLKMPGVFEVDDDARIGEIVEDVTFLAEASHLGEWEGQVVYLPFRRIT